MNIMTKEIFGDINNLPYKGLYTNLLGDDCKIFDLSQMLRNGGKPYYTWRQGNIVAMCFLKLNNLTCLFYYSEMKGIESFNYSKIVFDEITKA